MKNWDKPQLIELTVQNTKSSECDIEDFNALGLTRSPGPHTCKKGAYTPRDPANWNYICVYHGDGKWCNYTGQQKS